MIPNTRDLSLATKVCWEKGSTEKCWREQLFTLVYLSNCFLTNENCNAKEFATSELWCPMAGFHFHFSLFYPFPWKYKILDSSHCEQHWV
jgi:hypothetical protein